MSSAGTKVTSNDPKVEKAGTVTSDSLAGESISQGGSFGANSGAAASAQPSSSTTTNNTDTSGATTLPPSHDAASRDSSSTSGVSSQQGQGKESGVGPTYNDSTASGAQSYSSAAGGSSSSGGQPYNTTTGSGANVGAAPSYVHSEGQESRPHGASIKEGGFDSGAPNASFGDSATDIGGKNDPGRAALQDMQRADAASGNDSGNQKDSKITGDTASGYSALGGDTSA